jgi:hypothetical protein
MIPVDLAHLDQMDKSIAFATDLAKLYGAEVFVVSVTATTLTEIAHNPAEFSEKLDAFAGE